MSLCFSKGLGAPIGSMIVGSNAFIARAGHIRKGMGGGMRQAGVVTAPARVAVEETFLGGKLNGARERAKEIAGEWEKRGGRLQQPVETNMVWLDLEAAGVGKEEFVERAVEKGVKVIGGRLVVHYRMFDILLVLLVGYTGSAFTVELLHRFLQSVISLLTCRRLLPVTHLIPNRIILPISFSLFLLIQPFPPTTTSPFTHFFLLPYSSLSSTASTTSSTLTPPLQRYPSKP